MAGRSLNQSPLASLGLARCGTGAGFLLERTMNRQHAHVGMLVVFGRADGQRTRGRIVMLNPTRARVVSLEVRADHPSGTLFYVPYVLMRSAEDDQAPAT
jgi:hypothetical protein